MHRLKTLRRLGAVALATTTLALTATPAQAATVSDATNDIAWNGTPTSAERARTDVTTASYSMGDYVVLRLKVRAWANRCSTGIPCSRVTLGFNTRLYDSAGREFEMDMQRSDVYGNGAYLRYPNYTNHCDTGQIAFSSSTTYDYVQVKIPRSCFPSGRRIVGVKSYLSYEHDKTYGQDYTGKATVNWVPKA
ncbi:hypothetical protein [Nocardioides jiangxiensis]|uniref:Secreted protein n=1 Tax=Nocardioides jiangxiensis TaxID=3064524 RepID=A0ABT9B5E5_9ACTN|nr:hypothetical protein [Nocardioides sp. WY-20]MDO7868353.1 hypothetical protein [Nocardioides sp. WY-20]